MGKTMRQNTDFFTKVRLQSASDRAVHGEQSLDFCIAGRALAAEQAFRLFFPRTMHQDPGLRARVLLASKFELASKLFHLLTLQEDFQPALLHQAIGTCLSGR